MQDQTVTLPPIRDHTHFAQNTQSEYRPIPNLPSVSGSISDILAESHKHIALKSESDSITSNICPDCQKVLLHAFDHCLNKQGEVIPLSSTHEVDEEAHGKLLTDVPLFDIIKDPTRFNPRQAFENPQEVIEREKWVHKQAKKTVALAIPKVKGLGIKPRRSFSGAIYKRMLDAKEREITGLRTQLYESSKLKAFETENVRKLKQALNQSVNYYTFAEEWQQSEASRLQQDIRHLKAEASSMIAILINAEVEKQGLFQDIKGLRDEVLAEKQVAAKYLQQADDMKEKLRISYLEYIEANKTMAQLRREAEKGTEAVEQRNSMLQKNFTKLSFDYEASARDLKSSMGKCRELEFELAQLVKDLNTKGEALVKSVASEEMLKEKLDKTNSEFRKLLKAQEQLLVEKSKFESDSRTAEARNMQQIHELKSNLEKATTELAFISRNNHGLDSLAEEQGEEIESLKKALAVLKNENDIVTAKFLEADEFGKTGICKRDETIDLLTTRLFTSDKQVKALTDKSEFLSTQVTSLTTSLALETRNVEDLIAEVNLLKKSTETQAHRFNQQIEKLLSDKSYLSTEKKEFSDKLLLLRRELAEKKEELDLTTKKWKKSFSEKSDEFEKKCLAYNSMSDDYSALRERLAALSSMYNDALQEIELLKKEMNLKSEKQEETNAQLGTCRIKVAALTKEVEGLKQEILYARDKHNELTEKIRSGVSEKDKVIETHGQYKKDAQDQLRSKDDFIKKLDEKITFLDDSRLRLEQRIRELETDLSSTEKKLENTVEALVKENGIRDMLETQLKELRSSLQGEQRVRSELEKLQLGAKFCMSAGSSNILMMRDKKLQAVYLGLEDEAKRLSDLVKLMPLDFGSEEVYELPADLAKKKPRLASISMREKYTLPK